MLTFFTYESPFNILLKGVSTIFVEVIKMVFTIKINLIIG